MEIFWAALGSIARVLAAVAALMPCLKPLRKWLSPSEKQRATEAAREAADRFDSWRKSYIHPGELSDKQLLVEWLVADAGHAKVSEDSVVHDLAPNA
jgi:hypothetical protein